MLLGLALLLRLALAPFFGFYLDLQDYVNWGILFDQHPLGFYALATGGSAYELPNYPPLMIYLCGMLTTTYFGTAHLLGIQAPTLVVQAPQLVVWMKLPAILGDLGTSSMLYRLARRTFSAQGSLVLTASYAFSPAVLLDGALWGQTDGIPVWFILLALLCTLRGRGIWAGILFGVALMFKLQSVIFAPLILLYLWRWENWRLALQALSSMAGVVLLLWSPYLFPPWSGLRAFSRNLQIWAIAGHASDSAFNLWFLLGARRSPAQPLFAFFSPTSLGLLLFAAILLLGLLGIWKEHAAHRLFLGAALASVAFFVLTTLQHERYLYPAVALALAAALAAKRGWFFYAVPSITLALNLLTVLVINYPTEFRLGSDTPDHWNGVIIGAAFALTLVNIWLLGRMVVAYVLTLHKSGSVPIRLGFLRVQYQRNKKQHVKQQGGILRMAQGPLVVAVGSTNPVKVEPVQAVLARAFPRTRVIAVDAPSGVPAQPLGLEQMRRGALNRAQAALATLLVQQPDAAGALCWGVGLEGGVEFEAEVAWLTGAVAMVAQDGRSSLGWSPRIILPPRVAAALREGGELGPLMDGLTGIADSKKKLGAIGYLTNSLAPRGLSWEIAFACALAPFLHPELYP